MELQRITTYYDPNEDRIRLSGEDESGEPLALWLTRRLLNRLIPVLLQWLERHNTPGADSDCSPDFVLNLPWDEPLRQPPPKEFPICPQYLVRSVNITQGEALSLIFHHKDTSPTASSFSLAFGPHPLRQWLNALREQYEKAEWPMTCWPEWAQAPAPQEMLRLQ